MPSRAQVLWPAGIYEVTISLNVNNVTDVEYLDFQYLWADPMTYRFTLDYRF